jgi:hypothetical protein
MECGGCLRSVAKVRPEKLTRHPWSNAFSKVEITGEKRAAWAKQGNKGWCSGIANGGNSIVFWGMQWWINRGGGEMP